MGDDRFPFLGVFGGVDPLVGGDDQEPDRLLGFIELNGQVYGSGGFAAA